MELIAGEYHVDSSSACRQCHQLSPKPQVEEAVKVQAGIRELQEREHWIVPPKSPVRREMKEPRVRGMPDQAVPGRLQPGQPYRVRVDTAENAQLLVYPRSVLIGHS